MSDTTEPKTIHGTDLSPSLQRAHDFYRTYISSVAEAVGAVVLAVMLVWGVYGVGKSLFYDEAFNAGFEAGRASIARACANPDRSLAVARGCPAA